MSWLLFCVDSDSFEGMMASMFFWSDPMQFHLLVKFQHFHIFIPETVILPLSRGDGIHIIVCDLTDFNLEIYFMLYSKCLILPHIYVCYI
jgi:hypothetical protein